MKLNGTSKEQLIDQINDIYEFWIEENAITSLENNEDLVSDVLKKSHKNIDNLPVNFKKVKKQFDIIQKQMVEDEEYEICGKMVYILKMELVTYFILAENMAITMTQEMEIKKQIAEIYDDKLSFEQVIELIKNI